MGIAAPYPDCLPFAQLVKSLPVCSQKPRSNVLPRLFHIDVLDCRSVSSLASKSIFTDAAAPLLPAQAVPRPVSVTHVRTRHVAPSSTSRCRVVCHAEGRMPRRSRLRRHVNSVRDGAEESFAPQCPLRLVFLHIERSLLVHRVS